ncbi:MAG: hypothetical protein KF753_22150 [Caldilineaceae bacterium]|nr:hypothetical protein [Caldilineaceae bacterium]
MRLTPLARFAASILLVVLLYGLLLLRVPLAVEMGWDVRMAWLGQNRLLWMLGGWLTLAGVFGWMAFLVALMHVYSPAMRVATMLQSGLMLLSAGLLIPGVIVWMALLPSAADGEWAAFIDRLALAFLGGGLFMAGTTTAWITLDLALLQKLPWLWLLPGTIAAALWLPSPFLLPTALPALIGLALLVGWFGFWATRRTLPPVYQELSSDLLQSIRNRQ